MKAMKAPDKIYLYHEKPKDYFDEYWNELPASDVENICYIRKDIVDETVKTAEDHAYFAWQEKLREKMLEWAKEELGNTSILRSETIEVLQKVIDKLNSM